MIECKHLKPQKIETDLGTIYRCTECGHDITRWQRGLGNAWIKWRFYCARGEVFIADINGLWNMIGGGGMGIILYKALEGSVSALWYLPIIWAVQKLLVFWLGYMDYNHWKLAQRESTLGASLTPTMVQLLKDVRYIRERTCPEIKDPSILDQFNK